MNEDIDRHTPPSPLTPAPYGRACVDCSHSKCKCMIRKIDGRCERCHRLNKECRPSVTLRRRNPKKPVASKSARLEEKLDGLVSLLKAGTQSDAVAAGTQAIATADDSAHPSGVRTDGKTSPYTKTSIGSTTSGLSDQLPSLPVSTPDSIDSQGTLSNSSASILRDTVVESSSLEAENCLTFFRTHKTKFFPFVYIPPATTANQLRQERPFLWLCIMMVASRSNSQQQVLGTKVRDTLAHEMIIKSEQNIDLLLGLLAYIGWISYQHHVKYSLSVFTQLATSLVFDLALNKSLPQETQISLCINYQKSPKSPTVRTMEERRAVLGCFLITSIISTFLQKIDALRWTSHMDECLQILDERQECPTDEILVQQVRLQLVVEKATQDSWNDKHISAPLSFYLQALHSQFQEIKDRLSIQSQPADAVLAHLWSTDLTINEIALNQMPIITDNSSFKRIEVLYACVKSIRSWFDLFFTIPLTDYIEFPFSIFSQLIRCLVTLYRLSTLDDPAWDKHGVKDTADLLLIMDQVITNVEQAAAISNPKDSPEGDVFSLAAKKYRSIRLEWETKLRPNDLMVSTVPNPQNANDINLPEDLYLDFPDNDWMMDFLLAPNP